MIWTDFWNIHPSIFCQSSSYPEFEQNCIGVTQLILVGWVFHKSVQLMPRKFCQQGLRPVRIIYDKNHQSKSPEVSIRICLARKIAQKFLSIFQHKFEWKLTENFDTRRFLEQPHFMKFQFCYWKKTWVFWPKKQRNCYLELRRNC